MSICFVNLPALQLTIKEQGDRIVKLKARIPDLETILVNQENEPIANIDHEPIVESNGKSVSVKRNLIRKSAFQN